MAKQATNPFEQHVEKVVLGLTGLALVAVVGLFLISTPNTAVLDGRELSPAELDVALRQKAEDLARRLRQAHHELSDIEDYSARLIQAHQNGPLGMLPKVSPLLPQPVAWGLPLFDVAGVGQGQAKIHLAPVLACAPPKVKTGRSVGRLAQPVEFTPQTALGYAAERSTDVLAEQERRLKEALGQATQDIYWVAVATTFDLAEQRRLMRQHGYDPPRMGIYVVRFELQRQRMLPDGTFSPWQDVQTYLPLKLPEPPTVTIGPDNRVPTQQWEQLRWFRQLVAQNQQSICRPDPPLIEAGDPWQPPELPGLKTVLDLTGLDRRTGRSGLSPLVAGLVAAGPTRTGGIRGGYDEEVDRYKTMDRADRMPSRYDRVSTDRRLRGTGRPQPAPAGQPQLRAEALKKFRQAQQALKDKQLDKAAELLRELGDGRLLPAVQQRKLLELNDQLDQALQDRQREQLKKQLEMLQARRKAEQEGKLQEWLEKYGLPATLHLWAHDLTVVPGQTYRYRCRVVLYNWYVGVVSRLADRSDAQRVTLAGAWSAPSEPVSVESDRYMYLAGADPTTGEARMTVFKWYRGQWAKETFRVGIGDPIGQPRRVRLLEPDGQLSRPIEVDFTTGAVVVDIDFNRPCKVLVSRGSSGGFEFYNHPGTVALVYQDASGQLRERLQYQDGQDPKRQELAKAVRRPLPVRPPGTLRERPRRTTPRREGLRRTPTLRRSYGRGGLERRRTRPSRTPRAGLKPGQ